MALTDLATVKTFLGITDASKDALLNLLIPAVCAQIETYCGRKFDEATYKERVWSPGGDVLYLPNYPVTELRRIMLDDKYVMKIENQSSDAVAATVQVGYAEDGTKTFYLNVVGGANESNAAIDLEALAPNTLAQLKTVIEALGLGWVVTLVGGTEGYPATELLDFAAEPCLDDGTSARQSHDLYVPYDYVFDLLLENSQGRVKMKYGGSFPNEKYIFAEYVGGYATIPADLELLATRIVADALHQAERDITLKSERLGDYQWTAADTGTLAATIIGRYSTELVRWKRIAIGM